MPIRVHMNGGSKVSATHVAARRFSVAQSSINTRAFSGLETIHDSDTHFAGRHLQRSTNRTAMDDQVQRTRARFVDRGASTRLARSELRTLIRSQKSRLSLQPYQPGKRLARAIARLSASGWWEVNRKPVGTVPDFMTAYKQSTGKGALLLVYREGRTRYLVLSK